MNRTLPALLFTAIALCSALAAAEPAPKSTPAAPNETDTVRELMRAGVAEYKKGNLQSARDAFLQAWAIKPHYAIAASLAEVEMALGLYRSTAEHLEYYLSNLPDELGVKRSAAETQLAEARKHLTVLRVTVDAPDATVYMDGVAIQTGRELLVDPGTHLLVAERGTFRSKPREVVFVSGESRDERMETKQVEAPVAAAPAPSQPLAAATPPPDTTSPPPMTILIAGGALTLVAVGIGIGYTLDSSSAKNDADRLAEETALQGKPSLVRENAQCNPPPGEPAAPPACAALRDSLDQSNRSHDIAVGAFVAGGVLAAGTVATYFLWPAQKQEKHASVRVAPWALGGVRGAELSGEF
jgi:tetratricopeptide (TPR) repeat protein